MRLSCHKDDRRYTGPMDIDKILLDGVELQYVIIADDKAGYILRCKTLNGMLVMDDNKTEILTEELRGEVKFIMKNDRDKWQIP